MIKILEEIKKNLPDNVVDSIEFEAANIIIYTKNKDFFLNKREMIKDVISKFKKRIVLRLSPDLLLDEKNSEEKIKQILVDVSEIIFKFERARSKLTLEVDNVGAAIGKGGRKFEKN